MGIPQAIVYSQLAGLGNTNGLVTIIVPPVFYAFFGHSKKGAMGPMSVVSIVLGSILTAKASQSDKVVREDLAAALTLCVGLCAITVGRMRLGLLLHF